MFEFWENVIRLFRFFISSLTGLILVIIKPFINLYNNPITFLILILGIIGTIVIVYTTLTEMLGINSV
uniref:hypothetical protein n=1 Tax=Pulvinaster venetus TaxID=427767 RepID=UPI001FCE04BC|nr:hypothetical protein MW436_pgp157 [Pulvinaster venetus]UNJ16902.1 hypothetical protein [Pulvinaster venetus]